MHKDLLQELREFALTAPTATALMERIAQKLHATITKFNWVGFYLADPTDPGILLVGPFSGSFTPHARIPLNAGLCGAAASTGKTVVVNDVSKDPRYLAGSALVKSEIVIPIFAKQKLAAQLDIESYFVNTFTPPEVDFSQSCAKIVADYLAKS
jgi:L-methionine (R)-S-oxide reductase